ncbi:MAG TPA: YhjD/YihY/BrkB family envelope integrity protein [Solirubrobacteraceae bacterium]|nr:YhjD/YihY/BrkB family envelope integrity protein [Solirubrobacteraceae bacterium]
MTTTAHTADWEGQTMLDRDGEKIGTIEEIYLVEETGRPEWALVKMGSIRGRSTLVPISNAQPTADGVRAGYRKSEVAGAPVVDADAEPSDELVAAIYRHYGIAEDSTSREPHSANGSQTVERSHEQPARHTNAKRSPGAGDPHAASLGASLKRTVKEFSDDNLTHWAAALTYYGVLSIFPALLAMVSILGLIGNSATQPLLENLTTVAPGPAKEILTGAIEGLQSGGGAPLLFIISLAGAIWAASGYISAFMDASNAIYDVEEGRSIWKKLPVRIGVTVLMMVLLAAGALAVVLTGPIAEEAGSLVGVGDSAVAAWDIAKWPALVLIVSFMFAVLYYTTPNVKQPGIKSVLPGGVLAVALWIVVSALFALYVASFGSYDKTYGTLGGVIVFLVWLWLTNLAILLGAEFNAERARGRNIAKGHPASEEPYLPTRATP